MSRQTFSTSWLPTFESEMTKKPNITITSFGDGYEARQAAGINFVKQEWSLTFEYDRTTIQAIDTFLLARGAVESFYWTNPRSEQIIVVCDEWKVVRHTGYDTLTGTFRQVFEA